MSPALQRLRCGTDEALPPVTPLAAGPLTADLVEGGLRAVRWHGLEVLRAVAYVVRDRDWGTLAPTIRPIEIRQDADGFSVRYTARCAAAAGAVLACDVTITGRPDGTLAFAAEARPDADFETNRCGFCVLHPILGLAGRPVRIEHVDGRVRVATMPEAIEPWQPFMAVRAIGHAVAPGLWATCRLEGDTFEMEDQRNWSDASYKTYVRPLARPWPYVLPAGQAFAQSVTLSLDGDGAAVRPRGAGPSATAITLGEPVGVMPRFGLVVTPEEAEAVLSRPDRLADVAPQVLVLPFDSLAGHGRAAMERLARVRRLLPRAEAVLECVVPGVADPHDELAAIAALVRDGGLVLETVAVSPSVDRQSTPPGSAWPTCPPLEAVYAAARAAFPGLRLAGGMFSYFTELNRKRPPVALLDIVTHATCPIVHAADDRSVMQSLEAMPFVTRSARAIIGPGPYRIGPATIGMRRNPYGSRTFDNPEGRRLTMTHADPRQRGLFAAAWMIGYAAATEAAGLDAFTGAALTGGFGLLPSDATQGVLPAYHAARALAALAGARRLACLSSRPDRVLGVAAETVDGPVLWLANITDSVQSVVVPTVFGRVAMLDEATWAAAAGGAAPPVVALAMPALNLRPYAIARLDA